jgi:hypothetical protein
VGLSLQEMKTFVRNVELGNESFCPQCGINFQQKRARVENTSTHKDPIVDIQQTGGDVINKE